eukprot:CAMPEP_0197545188 /NCGR_PEP_ID=MMETSP1320-20131121/333_1 /TAXON_ID=91990 /ORGANISM="Bolidomonas sp., Strain RCC2347" /LENGTH=559 /DNA_ID=CAMNT_0043104677 /DNA_START=91 /DNA_END=1767 /DNA_ORIENTATION=+
MLKLVLLLSCCLDAIIAARPTRNPNPNIILILTDDQSDAFMRDYDAVHQPLLSKHITERGATIKNSFTTTAVCCPSRSSIYTGKYISSLGVHNNSAGSGGCASLEWQNGPEKNNIAHFLSSMMGYKTSFAGKYLNNYGFGSKNGTAFSYPQCLNATANMESVGMENTCASPVEHIPQGWDNWQGLVGNSVYYNYTLSNNGIAEVHGDDYHADYLTDLVKNRSLTFMKDMIASGSPFFVTASVPAAHENADAAPQHQGYADGLVAPRTPNYNRVMDDGRHWMAGEGLNVDGKGMNESVASFVDLLYRRRLNALQSVDDLIDEFATTLEDLGELDNTFIIYTSDNGYHLGQFGIPIDKRQAYESDVRVPLIVKGPGIQQNVTIDASYALNIDLAPTIMAMAGATEDQIASIGFEGKPILGLLQTGTTERESEFMFEYNGEAWDGCASYLANDISGVYFDTDKKFADGVQCGLRGAWSYSTPPVWEGETWSSVQDNVNNTYTCLRRIEAGDDFQFCAFTLTGEAEAYDLVKDPYQLNNLANDMSDDEKSTYYAKIKALREKN